MAPKLWKSKHQPKYVNCDSIDRVNRLYRATGNFDRQLTGYI